MADNDFEVVFTIRVANRVRREQDWDTIKRVFLQEHEGLLTELNNPIARDVLVDGLKAWYKEGNGT